MLIVFTMLTKLRICLLYRSSTPNKTNNLFSKQQFILLLVCLYKKDLARLPFWFLYTSDWCLFVFACLVEHCISHIPYTTHITIFACRDLYNIQNSLRCYFVLINNSISTPLIRLRLKHSYFVIFFLLTYLLYHFHAKKDNPWLSF